MLKCVVAGNLAMPEHMDIPSELESVISPREIRFT